MSGLVSASLALYLELSGAARRSARFVLTSGTPEARDLLLAGCERAMALAADLQLANHLAARARDLGLEDSMLTDDGLETEAVTAVRDARTARSKTTRPQKAARSAR